MSRRVRTNAPEPSQASRLDHVLRVGYSSGRTPNRPLGVTQKVSFACAAASHAPSISAFVPAYASKTEDISDYAQGMFAKMLNPRDTDVFSLPDPDPSGQVVLSPASDAFTKDIEKWMNNGSAGTIYNRRVPNNKSYTVLRPLAVYDVRRTENEKLRVKYMNKLDELSVKQCSSPKIKQYVAGMNGVLSLTTHFLREWIPPDMFSRFCANTSTNVQLLAHGAPAPYVMGLLKDGSYITRYDSQNPDETRDAGKTKGLSKFTVGNYFTDGASKADAFARPFKTPDGRTVSVMIISEVALGCPIFTNSAKIGKNQDMFGELRYMKSSSPVPVFAGTGQNMHLIEQEYEDYIRVLPKQAPLWDSTVVTDGDGPQDNITEYVTYGEDQQMPVAVVLYERGNDDGV